jgi:hypothetical protein
MRSGCRPLPETPQKSPDAPRKQSYPNGRSDERALLAPFGGKSRRSVADNQINVLARAKRKTFRSRYVNAKSEISWDTRNRKTHRGKQSR